MLLAFKNLTRNSFIFVANLQGQCIMLLEDGTSYEGEVAGVGVLGGKGVLRLPNGDVIQGTFHGSWSEGIKMNATLTKATISSSSSHAAEKPLLSSQINFNPRFEFWKNF